MQPLSLQFRRDLAVLTGRAAHQLTTGWRDFGDPRDTREWLTDALLALTDHYGLAAAALAADYYETLRDSHGASKRFAAIPAEPPPIEAVAALSRYAVGFLFGADPKREATISAAEGGAQRLIANVGRRTVSFSSVKDPSARGWQRVGVGECDFCQMLLGRGAVYTEATADFAAHDRCGCSAEPVFGP